MVFTMSSQEHLWLVNEESVVLVDDLSVSEDGDEDSDEVILNTYGRGKLLSETVLPRMPYTCINLEKPPVQLQEVSTYSQPRQVGHVGRGRARLLKNRLEKISKENLPLNCRLPNGLKTFHKDSEKPVLPRPILLESFTVPTPSSDMAVIGSSLKESKENSEMSSNSSLSLLDFPVLESPKKKLNKNQNQSNFVNSDVKEKTNKLSLNSLTNSILTSKSDETNTDSCISDDIQSSDELLVFDDDEIDIALDEHLSDLNERVIEIDTGACGDNVTERDNVECNHGATGEEDTAVCDSGIVTDWTLTGENTIQCDGLPKNCDISVLRELIASFGKIIDSQKISTGSSSSVRFQLGSSDSCEWAISCLHDSDCVYPDSNRVLECYRVDM